MRTTTDRSVMTQPSALRRVAWFVGLWAAGVAVTAAVAYGLRLIIFL